MNPPTDDKITVEKMAIPCGGRWPLLCPLGGDVAHMHVFDNVGKDFRDAIETINVEVDWRAVARELSIEART